MAICVRRYTHEQNRAFAFSFFSVILNLGCICGTLLINIVRETFLDGLVIWGMYFTWMDLVFVFSSMFTCYTIFAAYLIRDIQVLSDQPLQDAAFCAFEPKGGSLKEMLKGCA